LAKVNPIKKIIVAAVSARPFVKAAAQAGYHVIAMDVFADADTQRAAHQAFKITYANGGFVADEVERILSQLDLSDVIGFVYGSGFEAQPDLLERIEARLPLLGNRPIVVRNLKRAPQFFTLLDALYIPHPAVCFKALENAQGWLSKHAGGSGGTHVVTALQGVIPPKGYYYQQAVAGEPVSVLFLADGQNIKVIGFNRQWVASTHLQPYRYGGIVGHANLPEKVKQQLQQAAQKLTSAVGLRGLNSLDAVMHGDDIWVLEINPRLSSTFDLYQSPQCNLFDLHVQVCSGNAVDSLKVPQLAKARQVLYAPYSLEVPANYEWPAWVADVPVPNSSITADNPVCTVLAEAEDAQKARDLVTTRKWIIEDLIKTFHKKSV
jgi:predicted ATP-grasp superfamily ATP-dependent carboligase